MGVIPVLLVVALTGSAVGAATGSSGSPPPPQVPTPEAPPDVPNPGPPLTDEERVEIKRQLGTALPEWGPHTAGTVIEIAGRQVQLPEDVHVETVISTGLCAPGETCLDFPIWVLQRGDSRLAIAKQSGRPVPGNPNAEAFDFIWDVLFSLDQLKCQGSQPGMRVHTVQSSS